jgi:hypothetical protein
LKELYDMLNSTESFDWLNVHENGQANPVLSLRVSLDISISNLLTAQPKAIELFCLIGLLPGGCKEYDLTILWGSDWQKYTERLLRASLLVKKTENQQKRYTMLPFMNKYAQELLKIEEKRRMHKNVCRYILDILMDIFLLNGNSRVLHSNTPYDLGARLLEYESNIWACIYRAIDDDMEEDNIYRARRKEVDRLERSLYESVSNVRERSPSVNLDNSMKFKSKHRKFRGLSNNEEE